MLGMLVAEVTNMTVKEYLHEKIWSQIGMQDDAFYLTDKQEVEMSLGGLNVTLRDMAKFGQLYLNCLLYTSPSPRDLDLSRMPSSA